MRRMLVAVTVAMLASGARAQTSNPFTGNAAGVDEGRSLYNDTCTRCHGANGAAGEFGPGLAIPGRSYARNTDAEIFTAIKQGIPGTVMPAHQGKLSDEQIWKITAYVKGLRGTAIDAPAPGDVVHGEAVFWGKGQCGTCHMIHGRGGIVGPDLSNLAGLRKTNSIIDALTREQHRVYGPGGAQPHTLTPLPTYPVVRVTTADGVTVRGVLRNEDSFSMQILGLDEKLHLVDRSRLKNVVYEPRSLMPTDYDKRLSKDEFGDLVAFLTRLGEPPLPSQPPVRMPGKDPD